MISSLFNTAVYNPLYNGLVYLIDIIPWADVGIVVILFTIIIKLILFPLSKKAAQTQIVMREIDPQLKEIRKKYKDNKEEQAKLTMALYKENGVNPFSSILLVLIQLPIIFALYFVFLRGGLPEINLDILYSFIKIPESVNMTFLGILDVSERSIIISLLAGVTQFIQGSLIAPKKDNSKKKGSTSSLKDDFARTMQLQMKYVMPVVVAFIAFGLSALIGIYWTTSNLFMIGQELYLRRKLKKKFSDS